MGKKWEYEIQILPWGEQPGNNLESTLNALGNEGWELVQIVEKMYYFKREKRD